MAKAKKQGKPKKNRANWVKRAKILARNEVLLEQYKNETKLKNTNNEA